MRTAQQLRDMVEASRPNAEDSIGAGHRKIGDCLLIIAGEMVERIAILDRAIETLAQRVKL